MGNVLVLQKKNEEISLGIGIDKDFGEFIAGDCSGNSSWKE